MEEILKAQENDPVAESCDGEKEHCVPTDAEPNVADVTVHEEGASGIAEETEDAFSAEADFEEIIGLFPELAITEPACIAHADRYGELRRMGLSVREAFLATNTELVKREAAAAGESRARAKAHLTGIGRRSGSASGSPMTGAERSVMREFFGDGVSDATLEQYWRAARG